MLDPLVLLHMYLHMCSNGSSDRPQSTAHSFVSPCPFSPSFSSPFTLSLLPIGARLYYSMRFIYSHLHLKFLRTVARCTTPANQSESVQNPFAVTLWQTIIQYGSIRAFLGSAASSVHANRGIQNRSKDRFDDRFKSTSTTTVPNHRSETRSKYVNGLTMGPSVTKTWQGDVV